MELKTGDKVVCIDATGYLVDGETYTVDSVFSSSGTIVGISVKECVTKKGYLSYLTERFTKLEPPNLVAITNDDLEALLDAFIALDYWSEGTYVNMRSYSKVVDKIESQINMNKN